MRPPVDRRRFLQSSAAALASGQLHATPPRPNFLFLIADDLTFRAVRSLNNPEIETPNLDRLARRGCTFTHCFHQGSWTGAVCIASRSMLHSGLSAFHAQRGVETAQLWGQTLGAAGYQTSINGKWHLSDATLQRSFQTIGPTSGGMFESGPEAYHRPAPGNTWTPFDQSLKGQWLETNKWNPKSSDKIEHSARVWAELTTAELHRLAARPDPFFLYVGFNSPHDPRQAPKEFCDKYPADRIKLPPNYLPKHPFDQGDADVRDELLAPFPRTPEAVRVHRSEYYAHVTYLDAQIGNIIDALDASPQAANTYLILTADHGLAVGQHGLMGKQNLYDHSVRMPLFISGPGVPKGKRIDAFVYQHSMYATTCDLAGIPVPSHVEFPSLTQMLHAHPRPQHDDMFCWYRQFQRSVRTQQHKLIVYPQVHQVQLFDVVKDPWEIHNLAGQTKYAALQQTLLTRLHKFQADLADTLPPVTLASSLSPCLPPSTPCLRGKFNQVVS